MCITNGSFCGCQPQNNTAYGYIYNTTAQTVAVEANVVFGNNGELHCINHTAGTSQIRIRKAGVYAVWFYIAGVQPNQFTLYQNDDAVAGSTYASAAGNQPNPGMVIITADVDDVLTLKNHTSNATVTLQTSTGGTRANVNASILIQRITG